MRKLKRNRSFIMLSSALAGLTLILIFSALVKRSIASIDGSSGRTQPLIYDPPDYEDQYFDEESARLNIRNGRPHPKIALFNLDGADETTEHDSFGSEVALTVVPGFGDGPAGLDVVPSFQEQIRESGANRILVTGMGEKTFIPDGTARWAPDPRDRVLEGWATTWKVRSERLTAKTPRSPREAKSVCFSFSLPAYPWLFLGDLGVLAVDLH